MKLLIDLWQRWLNNEWKYDKNNNEFFIIIIGMYNLDN